MDRRLVPTWWILRVTLGVALVLVGLDKFFDVLTRWSDYLNPAALQVVPMDPVMLVRLVGIFEIVLGVTILVRWPRLGAYLAAVWFLAIAVAFAAMRTHFDLALNYLLLAVSAFTLARLTAVRQAELAERLPSDARKWEPSPREILTLKL